MLLERFKCCYNSKVVIFYRSHFTLRMNAHVGLRDAEQRVRTCISPEPGERGTERRTANYSATPAITIYSPRHVNSFLGPGYSSAIAGHAASRNTFLERLFIAPDFSDDAEFGEPKNARFFPISVNSDFQSPAGTRGTRRALLFQPRWLGRTGTNMPGFINKDIDMVGMNLSGKKPPRKYRVTLMQEKSKERSSFFLVCS